MGVFLVSAEAGAKGFDPELIHHILVVLLGCPIHGLGQVGATCAGSRGRGGRCGLLAEEIGP
jgi:hypothetical protein